MRKLGLVLWEELGAFHLRLFLSRIILAPFPIYVAQRLRVVVLRLAGIQIGHGTVMWGAPRIIGHRKGFHQLLQIGNNCMLNFNCLFDLADRITIGNGVSFGQEVALITGTHEIGAVSKRAGVLSPQPIYIEDGAWLGARSVVLPGVTVGRGAIVAAGAVVVSDVLPNTIVGGVPARVIRELDEAAALPVFN